MMKTFSRSLPAVVVLAVLFQARVVWANPNACEVAIQSAEASYDIPPGLMLAIGRVEAGRSDPATGGVQIWPWTTNAGGKGAFYDDAATAAAAVIALRSVGTLSIDVGCVQINLQAHPDAFSPSMTILDPLVNARYGARFLSQLHGELGSWSLAVAAYHSRTPGLGQAYLARVTGIKPGVPAEAARPVPTAWAPRGTQFAAFPAPTLIYGAFTTARAKPRDGRMQMALR